MSDSNPKKPTESDSKKPSDSSTKETPGAKKPMKESTTKTPAVMKETSKDASSTSSAIAKEAGKGTTPKASVTDKDTVKGGAKKPTGDKEPDKAKKPKLEVEESGKMGGMEKGSKPVVSEKGSKPGGLEKGSKPGVSEKGSKPGGSEKGSKPAVSEKSDVAEAEAAEAEGGGAEGGGGGEPGLEEADCPPEEDEDMEEEEEETEEDQEDNPAGEKKRATRSRDPAFAEKRKKFIKEYQKSVGAVERRSGEEAGKKRRRSQDSSPSKSGGGAANDNSCWVCHRDGRVVCCETCPRVFHLKCAGLSAEPPGDWVCVECKRVIQAETVQNLSPAMQMLTPEQFRLLLKHAVGRLKGLPGAEPFINPVDEKKFPNYGELVACPMNLATMEENLNRGEYGSTEAFVADCKWIVHNCILFNGTGSKLTQLAKSLLRMCKWEMEEIETCPDCYRNAYSSDEWFTAACPHPHLLIWARLKGFPYWPAKAVKSKDGNVDCRFFGRHDRAWVPIKECYLFSKEPPSPAKARSKSLDACLEELEVHIANLETTFGKFVHSKPRTVYDPRKIVEHLKLMLPAYDCNIARPDQPSARKRTISNVGASGQTPTSERKAKRPAPEMKQREPEEDEDMEDEEEEEESDEEEEEAPPPPAKVARKTPAKPRADAAKAAAAAPAPVTDTTVAIPAAIEPRAVVKREPVAVGAGKLIPMTPGQTPQGALRRVTKVQAVGGAAGQVGGRGQVVTMKAVPGSQTRGARTNGLGMSPLVRARPGTGRGSPGGARIGGARGSPVSPRGSPGGNRGSPGGPGSPRQQLMLTQGMTAPGAHQTSPRTSGGNQAPRPAAQTPSYALPKPARLGPMMLVPGPKGDTGGGVAGSGFAQEPTLAAEAPSTPAYTGLMSAELKQQDNNLSEVMRTGLEQAIADLAAGGSSPATIAMLRLQIDRQQWRHQIELAEQRKVTDTMLAELRGSMEIEQKKAANKLTEGFALERGDWGRQTEVKVAETKKKQWCATCGKEAIFYCCWNTSYCDFPCQEAQWPRHMLTCANQQAPGAAEGGDDVAAADPPAA